MALAEGRTPSLKTHHGPDSLSYSVLTQESVSCFLLPGPQPGIVTLRGPTKTASHLHVNLLLGLHSNPASSKKSPSLNSSSCVATHGSAWPSLGSGRTLKGHRTQRVLLSLVRPTPNVTHTSWFLGDSKSIRIFFLSPSEWVFHGRVKGATSSSVFLLELGLLGCKSLRARKSPSP